MRPPGFAMYLLHFHRIRCRCSFRQNSGYNERRRRKVRCRQQRFQLLPSQSGWRLQLRFPCTTDRKKKADFFVFSISSCLQCEQDQADQRSDSANCNHQKKELHFRKPLAVDLTVLGEIVACCQIRIQCNKDLLIIICNLIVQQIASRCFHGRAVFFLLHKNGLCRHRRSGQQQRRTDRTISAQWLLCNHFSRNPHSYRYFLLYPPDSTRDWHRPHRR